MKMILNGRELSDVVSDRTALGAALKAIQDEQIPPDEVIARILIDGEPLSAEQLAQWKDRPLADFQETRIEAKTKTAFAAECLRVLAEVLEHSGDLRNQISDQLCKGRGSEAMKSLQEYMRLWLGVQQSLTGAARLLEIDLDAVELYNVGGDNAARPVLDYINRLTEQLTEVKTALQAGDYILVGDILDYEFGAITIDWQNLLRQLADRFDSAA
jgi:hypothetical protein